MISLYQPSSAFMDSGFSLTRLDPLEAKRNQIIELLRRSTPLDSENATYPYITRQNMVHLCHLYGRHFQHNLPIIHAPTFDMLKTPPILLLAVMLVGACYSKGSIPPAEVTKLAMRLLTAIAAEPVISPSSVFIAQGPTADVLQHEETMQCPKISVIQAGILISCILSCCRDIAALNSVRICFARNISVRFFMLISR
jgi:Fungal specific transcription factor domain